MNDRCDAGFMPNPVTPELIEVVRDQYALDWHGLHGISHFNRVRENGLRVAESTGAMLHIVQLFAFLHDSKRVNDAKDPGHGPRAAAFARELNGSVFSLSPYELDLLAYACEHHTEGMTEGDITVQTCWDADRLDLWRASIWPKAEYLCTDAARSPEMIHWASKRIK
jgi:uncharacterized protein